MVEPSLECMSWYELPPIVMDNQEQPTALLLLLLTSTANLQRHFKLYSTNILKSDLPVVVYCTVFGAPV